MQESWVWSLIWDNPTCHRASKAVGHNYWAPVPQLLKFVRPRACAPQQEKPLQWEVCKPQLETSPCLLQLEKSPQINKDPAQPKINVYINKIIKKSNNNNTVLYIWKLQRNLYAGQEAALRTGCVTTDWFQIGKGVRRGCILSPCLFNLYAEYIMRHARLDEAQARIKIAGSNINNLTYTDDTFMAESKEEHKNLLMKVKQESEKVGLKFNSQKNKIMASGPITSWQIDGETMETVTDYFFWLQNHCRWWLQPWN